MSFLVARNPIPLNWPLPGTAQKFKLGPYETMCATIVPGRGLPVSRGLDDPVAGHP